MIESSIYQFFKDSPRSFVLLVEVLLVEYTENTVTLLLQQEPDFDLSSLQ